MSFNKHQDFEKAAQDAERLFMEQTNPAPETTPVPVQEVAPVIESAPVPNPVAEPVVDPAKPIVDEDKYKASVKAMNEAQREAANLRKQQEQIAKEKDELQQKLDDFIRQSKQRPVEAPDDDLEIDMPEVAKIAERKALQAERRLEEKLAEINKWKEDFTRTQLEREAESSKTRFRQSVLAAHPDFDEVVNSDEMVAWVNNEAPPIFKSIYDGSVPFSERDVIAVVSQFKQAHAPKAQAHSKPNAADIAAPVRTSPVISTNAEEDRPITEAELNDFMHNAQRKTPAEMDDFNRRLDKHYGKP